MERVFCRYRRREQEREHVYACEMFKGWAEIARKNVTENGFDYVITVINKHSSSLVVKSAAHPDDYGLIVLSL